MRKDTDYTQLPDIRDSAVKQQLAREYVGKLIAVGKSPLDTIAKNTPDAWANLPKDSIVELGMAFDLTPPSPSRSKAVEDFYENIELSLKNNPQTFQKVINTPAEASIDKVLGEYAALHPGSSATLKELIAATKAPQPLPPPARVMPEGGPAPDATGNPTETQPITAGQKALFHDSEGNILTKAAAPHGPTGATGWDAWVASNPEDVLFIALHRKDLPTVQHAAEGALRRAGHIQ